MSTFSLDDIIAPLQREEFLEKHFGSSYCHLKGGEDRFKGLLPWSKLNSLLSERRLDQRRLRLIKGGRAVPADQIFDFSAADSSTKGPRVRVREVTQFLGDGATLIVNGIEDMYEPIRDLSLSVERAFSARVVANAYAGWGETKGFDLHWDDHDVIVLQLSGRKQWQIYGESRQYPLPQDVGKKIAPPSSPLWQGTLLPGDVLYMPRGWWHVATALAEPTLHITLAISNLAGYDFLKWLLVESANANAAVRRDIPRFASIEVQGKYLDDIKHVILEHLTRDSLSSYLKAMDERAPGRPMFSLPISPNLDRLPQDKEVRVVWTAPRSFDASLESPISDEKLLITVEGRDYLVDAGFHKVLRLLAKGEPISTTKIYRECPESISSERAQEFVKMLIRGGVLAIYNV